MGVFIITLPGGTYSLHSFPETLTLAKRKDEHNNSCVVVVVVVVLNSTMKHSFGHVPTILAVGSLAYIKNVDGHFACSSSVICCKPGPSAGP